MPAVISVQLSKLNSDHSEGFELRFASLVNCVFDSVVSISSGDGTGRPDHHQQHRNNSMKPKSVETESTVAVAEPQNILVHTRDAADAKTLLENFDINKLDPAGVKARYTTGLTLETRTALLSAHSKGTRIVTSGLPLDIAAEIGEVTLIRAWNKERADGTRTSGCQSPVLYFAAKVKSPDAMAALKATPEFAACFGSKDEPEGSSEMPF